ncbi:hypothetical protein [Garciella nitratireducens]|uniref:Yip1 domain-containing protein n=1 Tax=Garciella nitratireducens DSM 15102 TaxID=1121911 RepID=A0A1T4NEI1_9FIRM|nr:hypothetical protein [Garciella nitratireducens]RBP44097.1 hypothetical protein DFR81_10539 [Garciella nitratireducens]SJZ77407.1 hypothetical protein SAMN02745973_01658 [Garciella nitratireducens DSM 15102]
MSKKKSNLIYWFLVPYLITCIMLFFQVVATDKTLDSLLIESLSIFNLSKFQSYVLISMFVIIINMVILFVVFLICKGFTQVIGKIKGIDVEILVSQLVSYIFSNLISLFIQDIFSISRLQLSLFVPPIELVLFLVVFFYFTKNKKAILYLFFAKFLILVANYVSLLI